MPFFSPVLGVQGTPQRTDVQIPSTQNPCGIPNAQVANKFASSTTVTADANGNFEVTAENFNGTPDGSLKAKSGRVSPNGTPTFNDELTITANGNDDPSSGNQQATIKAQLPKGLKCTGPGNKCLAQFITTAGFGNCVVVQQGGQSGKVVPASGAGAPTSSSATGGANTKNGVPASGAGASTSSGATGGANTKNGTNTSGGKANGGGKTKNVVNANSGGKTKSGEDLTNGGNTAGGNSAGGGTAASTGITASCTPNAASSTASADPANASITGRRVSGRHMARLLSKLRNRGEGVVQIAK